MSVLVDSSVWVDYFRDAPRSDRLDFLIEENLVVLNDLILAELTPALYVRKQQKLIRLLREIMRIPLNIDWEGLTKMQIVCLRNGINKVGIPDLIIAQYAIQNNLPLFTHDKHFSLLAQQVPLTLY
ncbi:MAG: PIN domain-containing protein [Kiritimatiellae bacterium]|nr:PIN domain-containing protein [Kiritimatiellia bacterium]MDD4734842.1 PIN domain-containing protein [Kiritimatiellia bacterium]